MVRERVEDDVAWPEPDRVVHLQQRVRLLRDRPVRIELRAGRDEDPPRLVVRHRHDAFELQILRLVLARDGDLGEIVE